MFGIDLTIVALIKAFSISWKIVAIFFAIAWSTQSHYEYTKKYCARKAQKEAQKAVKKEMPVLGVSFFYKYPPKTNL